MTDWKEIHPDFAFHNWNWETNYQEQWEKRGFSYEQTKEWIEIGLVPSDAEFATWLKKKNYTPKSNLSIKGVGKLRESFFWIRKRWTDIHEEFDVVPFDDHPLSPYREGWEEAGFTREEAWEWIDKGFRPSDYWEVRKWKKYGFTGKQTGELIKKSLSLKCDLDFAVYLREKSITDTVFEKEQKSLIYLNWKYPLEQRGTFKSVKISYKNLIGPLIINDWPQLEKVEVILNYELTFVKIINCPQLTTVGLWNNKLANLVIENCPKVESLDISNNEIKSNLHFLNKMSKLKTLNIKKTNANIKLEYLPSSLEVIIFGAENDLSTQLKKLAEILKLYKKDKGSYNYQKWRKDNCDSVNKIHKNDSVLTIISIINSAITRENQVSDELTKQEKVLQTTTFYLEEEIKNIRKELYEKNKAEVNIEIPPK